MQLSRRWLRATPAPTVEGVAVPIARPLPSTEAARRLGRLRSLAWFLDRSIPIGGKWRIGVDPIIGLLPGAGDWIGALLSIYVLYEGARLGLPLGVLGRMGGNVLIETVFGAVPVLGDLFDFAWQANARNVALVEQHYRPGMRARGLRKLWLAVLVFTLVVLTISGVLVYFAIKGVVALLH
jgi:hypothetical protein